MAVLVAGTDQLDQWLMTHPREVFRRAPEPAVVNLANPSVLLPQLACAAYEQPLSPDDDAWWGDALDDGVRQLVQADRVRLRDGRAYWSGRGLAGAGARPALGLAGGVPHRRARRPPRGHGRRQPGLRAGPPRRDLPPPRPAVPRGAARPGRPGRARGPGRRRRVHAGPQRPVGDDPRRPRRRRWSAGSARPSGRSRSRRRSRATSGATPDTRRCSGARSSTSRRPGW